MIKRLALFVACALGAAACASDSTSPSVATTIVLSSSSVALDAIGASQIITATVNDQRGDPMSGATVTWASSSAAVAVGSSSSSAAVITAALNGNATVTASAGGAKATVDVSVLQKVVAFQKVAGDLQTGAVNSALPQLVSVKALDRMGSAIVGQAVAFAVTQGNGTVAQSTVTTTGDGLATTTWTLGKVTSDAQALAATAGPAAATFTATAVAGPPTMVTVTSGDRQSGMVGTALAAVPTVVVSDAFSNVVPNVKVDFVATGSSVASASATTDSRGLASAGIWTLGTVAGSKSLSATVAGVTPATFTAAATPAPATDVVTVGDGQSGRTGALLLSNPGVRVVDVYGNGVAGVGVTFVVTSGGGSITGATPTTDANGYALLGSWRLGSSAGTNTVAATPSVTGLPSRLLIATAIASAGPSTMTIVNGGNQAAFAGAAVPTLPAVTLTDAQGNPAAGVTVTFTATSGGGSVTGGTATSNADGVATVGGWTTGGVATLNILTASASGYTPVTFNAAGCEGGGAGYAITVCYRTSMTASQRQAFVDAAAKWGSVITSDLPDAPAVIAQGSCDATTPSINLTIDDLLIFAGVEPIDGAGNVLGAAGWCFRRTGGLPVIGTMRFDVADVVNLESRGQFGAVIMHEMGHVIGIGTVWSAKGLLQNPSSTTAVDTYFWGSGAIAAFNSIGGSSYTGMKVPVENTGGIGTVNSHWRESVMNNELMTGYLNAGSNPLSLVTVRSLEDIGYTVNAAAADPFNLTLGLSASRAGDPDAIQLGDDTYRGRQGTIDTRGKISPIR